MKRTDFFFSLVRSALWGESLPPIRLSPTIFRELMETAKVQTVQGLVAESLMRNQFQLERQNALETFACSKELSAINNKMYEALAELCTLLKSHDIDFIVVKGQTISALYRVSDMRTPGDIDFYCDVKHFERAKQVISEAWKIDFEDEDFESEQHISFSYNQILFEMHFRLMHFSSSFNQRWFDTYLQESPEYILKSRDLNISTLSPELNVLYTFLHLYHHLMEMGVSIRQFCDLAVLLYNHTLDTNKLKEMLLQLDFMRAFTVIGCILVHKLGLPAEKFPFKISEKNYHYAEFILSIVFTHGNFGFYNRKHRIRSGFSYYMESLRIKLSHYWKLYRLSPRENRAVILKSIPLKVWSAFGRSNH